jgi:FKBP-type peptidyl-prolyl cis-trans isomerase SlyD
LASNVTKKALMSQKEQIEAGKVVTMRYALTGPDGKVLDESDDEGMDYLHGADNIVPGLEKQLVGHIVGDTLTAVVSPEEGYGQRKGSPQMIPRSSFPDDVELEVGMEFEAEGPNGEPLPLWITAVTATEVEIDRNHPLAGMELKFEVEIVAIRAASDEEKAHGHPHGPDGHGHHHH